jgi:hypothetical protein
MVRAGRSFHQVAYEFSVSEHVIAELYSRDLARRTQEFVSALSARIDAMDADLRGRAAARKDAGRAA